ncbi:MAG: hypothetical protein IK092_02925, partial [Muribaculaceae bacterium]|nr:hypothetical protein [Muribaculaceae bacterium]
YILGHTDLMEGKIQYDESNWVALTISGQQELPALVGSKLKGVKGTLTDANNPTFALLEMPTAYDTNSYDYDLNVFIVPSFGDNEQEIGDKTYFFVNPKPMEIATVTWAMWDEASECFKTPTQVGSSNQLGFEGSINVDMSQFAGNAPTLQDGNIYSFTALIRKNASSASGAPRRAPGDGYTIYALEGMQKIGSIEGDVVTGNANVKVNGDVLRVVYSNEAGQVSSTPWKGVNIVVTIYTDGKRTVTKRMF